jgi:hypothetical protein
MTNRMVAHARAEEVPPRCSPTEHGPTSPLQPVTSPRRARAAPCPPTGRPRHPRSAVKGRSAAESRTIPAVSKAATARSRDCSAALDGWPWTPYRDTGSDAPRATRPHTRRSTTGRLTRASQPHQKPGPRRPRPRRRRPHIECYSPCFSDTRRVRVLCRSDWCHRAHHGHSALDARARRREDRDRARIVVGRTPRGPQSTSCLLPRAWTAGASWTRSAAPTRAAVDSPIYG